MSKSEQKLKGATSMKKIAVFGKPGGGKSTLSKQLGKVIGVPLYPLDLIEYQANGEKISSARYAQIHAELLGKESWIIEGLGSLESFWQRVNAADTLIYIDLPYRVSYWWVVKRCLLSVFVKPEGWPQGSSIIRGTIAGWKYLGLSKKFWTEALFEKITMKAKGKKIYRIRTVKALNEFVSQFMSEDTSTDF